MVFGAYTWGFNLFTSPPLSLITQETLDRRSVQFDFPAILQEGHTTLIIHESTLKVPNID